MLSNAIENQPFSVLFFFLTNEWSKHVLSATRLEIVRDQTPKIGIVCVRANLHNSLSSY